MFYLSDTTRVRFKHYNHFTGEIPKSKLKRLGETLCLIETKHEDGEWYMWTCGIAQCSTNEVSFNKAVGRKLSLTKALMGGKPEDRIEPKSLRRDFWEAYFRHAKR